MLSIDRLSMPSRTRLWNNSEYVVAVQSLDLELLGLGPAKRDARVPPPLLLAVVMVVIHRICRCHSLPLESILSMVMIMMVLYGFFLSDTVPFVSSSSFPVVDVVGDLSGFAFYAE
jgi:hypothetical protein